MLTESQAWRTIGEAFEARAAHPELRVKYDSDIARYGTCAAAVALVEKQLISYEACIRMREWITEELDANQLLGLFRPLPYAPGSAEVRAMYAYLMAEATA